MITQKCKKEVTFRKIMEYKRLNAPNLFRNLCDMKQTGKLTGEQFALAMWLIQQKLAGVDPPAALTPEMVPPTLRPKPLHEGQTTVSTFLKGVITCDFGSSGVPGAPIIDKTIFLR